MSGIQIGHEVGQVPPEQAQTLEKLGVIPDKTGEYDPFFLRVISQRASHLEERAIVRKGIDLAEFQRLLRVLSLLPELSSVAAQALNFQEKVSFYDRGSQNPKVFSGVYINRADKDPKVGLPTRIFNALLRSGFVVTKDGLIHAEDIVCLSEEELMAGRTIGPKTIEELKQFLFGLEVHLGAQNVKEVGDVQWFEFLGNPYFGLKNREAELSLEHTDDGTWKVWEIYSQNDSVELKKELLQNFFQQIGPGQLVHFSCIELDESEESARTLLNELGVLKRVHEKKEGMNVTNLVAFQHLPLFKLILESGGKLEFLVVTPWEDNLNLDPSDQKQDGFRVGLDLLVGTPEQ